MEVEFPWGDQGKTIWDFHGSWFLAFPSCVTQFCGISRGE